MEKEHIILSLDFIFGPISKEFTDSEGNAITNIKVVDDNKEIQALDNKINELWSSLWIKNDSLPSGYDFDKKREKEISKDLLGLISNLKQKLDEVNDGSFVVDDMISDYLKSLIQ